MTGRILGTKSTLEMDTPAEVACIAFYRVKIFSYRRLLRLAVLRGRFIQDCKVASHHGLTSRPESSHAVPNAEKRRDNRLPTIDFHWTRPALGATVRHSFSSYPGDVNQDTYGNNYDQQSFLDRPNKNEFIRGKHLAPLKKKLSPDSLQPPTRAG
jgi:hypothetical protein